MVMVAVQLVDFMDARPLPGATLDFTLTVVPRFPVSLPEDPGPELEPRPDSRFAETLRERVTTDADGRASVVFDDAEVFARLAALERQERPQRAVDAVGTLRAGATILGIRFDRRDLAFLLPQNATLERALPVDLGMSIVGHTTPTTVRLWFHLPFQPDVEHEFACDVMTVPVNAPRAGPLPLEGRLLRRTFPVAFNQPANTAVIDVTDLAPDHVHEYALVLRTSSRQFAFVVGRFRTPDASQSGLAIAFGSCHLPVLTGTPEEPSEEARRSLELWQRLADRTDFEALLLIGDQIYGDEIDTKWADTDDWFTLYTRRYRQLWAYRPVREVLRTTPTYMILDDHDVKDDFGVVPFDEPGDTRVPDALRAYRVFQHAHNPGGPDGPLHFSFTWGPASFFVSDGRTNLGKSSDAPVLGRDQRAAIETWASSPETLASDVIFFVAPVPFALLPSELIRKVVDELSEEAFSTAGFLVGLALGLSPIPIPPFPGGGTGIGNAAVLGATGFLAAELAENHIDRNLLVKGDLGERWDRTQNQPDLIWLLDLLFDLANGVLAADQPPRKRAVFILSGDIHSGTMHLIRSLPEGRGNQHAANPLITQLTSSALSHTPVDSELWIAALSKIDDDLDIDVKPLGVLKLFDGGFDWETLAKDLTNIEEVFGKGKGAYFLDPDHDRRYLTQFSGLLMERTVGFVRVTRSDAQRRSYRFELVIEGQLSSPLRSVIDIDLDAPSPPGLKIIPQPITFGSVPLGEVRTRTLTIENASGANVDVSIAPSPTVSPFTWPSFSGVLTHRAQQQITVQFRPSSNAFVDATLTVTSNAPGSPQSVTLTGKGPGGIPPDPGPGLPTSLDVSPTVMSFGAGPLGTVRRRTLTIGNMTGAMVNLSVSPPPAGPFRWTAFTGTLAHGARRQIEVQFRATSNAIAGATLTITSNTRGSPQSVTMTGKGPGGF
jgi:hypothetical protein